MEELRLFVDDMKRGLTPATGDSLLETLRQIHDRREAPVVGHDHKRMLAERLRRQMRVRNGEPVVDAIRVPEFATAPARRRFLQWAVAASLAFHVGLGVVALDHLHFGRIFAVAGSEEASAPAAAEPVRIMMLPPVLDNRAGRNELRTVDARPSAGRAGNGHETSVGPIAIPNASPVHSASSAPVGPPVLPGGGAPIVAGFNSSGVEGQADYGIPEGVGPSLGGPPTGMGDQPDSRIAGIKFDRDRVDAIEAEPDIMPRALNRPSPIYPSKALEYQITGTVRVSAVVAADGTISDFRVLKSKGYGLDEAAIDAVRRMKFSPAMRNGVPVKVRVNVDVDFALR